VFNKYYQDELSFLREMGREFSQSHPDAAPYLAEAGADPDVERLLEGFAFLSGRIRQKLDDAFPEITHSLMQLLWPHYLRPIPAMTVVQFEALPQAAKEPHDIPRGAELESMPVDGTPCHFRTVYDVRLEPLVLDGVEFRSETPPQLKLKFRLSEGVLLKKTPISKLRLFLQGEPVVTRALYLCLQARLKKITLRAGDGPSAGKTIEIPSSALQPGGFKPEEGIFPMPLTSFEGYRLLLEYFAFPTKFLFLDLTGLEALAGLGEFRTFEAIFEMDRLPGSMPPLGAAGILLNCTPAVNLFKRDADPIRVENERTEYKLWPSGGGPAHFEVYTVDAVIGLVKGTAKRREYKPFLGFAHSLSKDADDTAYYQTRLESSVAEEGTETFISFAAGGIETLADIETLTIDLTCTNRQLPGKLKIGDIKVPTASSPSFARFKNITKIMPSVPPPLGTDAFWRLLSHLTVNYTSLARAESLRSVIGLYNFRAMVDRQAEQANRLLLEAIQRVEAKPTLHLFRGEPVRGMAVTVEVNEDGFSGEGDVYLFGSLLREFFSLYASLNSFTQLTVRGTKYGEVYTWRPKAGGRITL
jgi:type VI secretion system protein ImpG